MGNFSLAALAGMGMLAILIMTIGAILVGALALCIAFRVVVGYMPSYVRSIGAVLLTAIASMAVYVVMGMLASGGANGLLAAAAAFLIGAALVNHLLRAQNGLGIGYAKACVVQLIYLVIAFVLWVIVAAILAVLFGNALAGMH